MIHRALLLLSLTIAAASLASAETALEDRYFDSDGVRIRYVETGRGEPVLLIHAMAESVEMWRNNGIIDELAKDFRVIAFDARGHGKSDKPHDPNSYGVELAEDAGRLLDHLRIARAHIVGYSMGGYIAGRFVASHPERVFTATFGGSSVMSPVLWATRFDSRVATIADALDRDDARPLLLFSQGQGENLEQRSRDLLSRNDPRALAAAVRSFKAMSLTLEEIEALPMPLLLIVGSEDVPDTRVGAFEGLKPNLEVSVIQGATHGGSRGAPRRPEFALALRVFLGSNASGGNVEAPNEQ